MQTKKRSRVDNVDHGRGFLNCWGKGTGEVEKVYKSVGGGGLSEVGSEGGRNGKEKTRLPQHDLQIALSPWRLLSALSSIQSGSSNSDATV